MATAPTQSVQFDQALNLSRQALYRFSALALLDPRARCWSQLSDPSFHDLVVEAVGVVRDEPAADAASLALGELALETLNAETVLAKLPNSEESFNTGYERTFGLLVSGACPPYESEYVNSKFTFQRSNLLADVAGFYSAFGLETSPSRPERPDHIVLELEFMAFLLGRERHAVETANETSEERMKICRQAQARFFEEHLAWWVPTFAKLLTLQDPDGFYGRVGHFLASFVPAERALLGVAIPETGPAAPEGGVVPSTLEPPESCEGCELHDIV